MSSFVDAYMELPLEAREALATDDVEPVRTDMDLYCDLYKQANKPETWSKYAAARTTTGLTAIQYDRLYENLYYKALR